ncbi:MAG: hypothetical protein HOE90_12370 [Bacteriovoracaceae bacterium]|jgi:hypothetical protein|nr:hypothetical protein [Bacteriovoracaceae bacterium]
MHEFYKIETSVEKYLREKGFEKINSDSSIDHFGSILTEFSKDKLRLKLYWSGEEGSCQTSFHNGIEWRDLSTEITESKHPEFENAICELIREIESLNLQILE